MEVVADRLSLRWYLGYDLHEPLPDHSSLTRIRERYGLEIFRSFFDRIVEMCVIFSALFIKAPIMRSCISSARSESSRTMCSSRRAYAPPSRGSPPCGFGGPQKAASLLA